MPSITRCGSPSSTVRSMNAPGSPSSALQRMYLVSSAGCWAKRHFSPVGKPAPPRPRRPEAQDLFDDLLGGHLGEHLGEGLVAVAGDVVVDLERVDDARVAQHDLDLAVEELDVVHLGLACLSVPGAWLTRRSTTRPLSRCSSTISAHVVDLDVLVEDAVGVDERDRALRRRGRGSRSRRRRPRRRARAPSAPRERRRSRRERRRRCSRRRCRRGRGFCTVSHSPLHSSSSRASTIRSAAPRPACRRRGALTTIVWTLVVVEQAVAVQGAVGRRDGDHRLLLAEAGAAGLVQA